MNDPDIVVGLDIGTTKICALVGRRNEFGKIEVLGMGKTESLGVMRGVVANIEKTVQSIKLAVEEAAVKSGCGEDIVSVYVGIAGQHIKSLQHNGIYTRPKDNLEDEISNEDIDALKEEMYQLAMQPGDKIIHVLPQEYIIDGEQGVKDPVGMSGVRLEANFHIITGQVTAISNIKKCVDKAGLQVSNLILEPLASSESVLSDQEKEAGVALVDIGGGTTDLAIFQDGIIRHTAVIPFGGNIITEDIKEGCTVMKQQAEELKMRFGSAMAHETQENTIVTIPGLRGRPPKEISVRNLSHIIQARMEEILEHVKYEIQSSGYEKKLIGGVVITGGGSQLEHLKQLVEYVTGMDARIGYPTEHLASGMLKEIKNPMYATGIGLMLKGFKDMEHLNRSNVYREREVSKKPTFWNDWLKKGKTWFEQDIKNEF